MCKRRKLDYLQDSCCYTWIAENDCETSKLYLSSREDGGGDVVCEAYSENKTDMERKTWKTEQAGNMEGGQRHQIIHTEKGIVVERDRESA